MADYRAILMGGTLSLLEEVLGYQSLNVDISDQAEVGTG